MLTCPRFVEVWALSIFQGFCWDSAHYMVEEMRVGSEHWGSRLPVYIGRCIPTSSSNLGRMASRSSIHQERSDSNRFNRSSSILARPDVHQHMECLSGITLDLRTPGRQLHRGPALALIAHLRQAIGISLGTPSCSLQSIRTKAMISSPMRMPCSGTINTQAIEYDDLAWRTISFPRIPTLSAPAA